MMGEEHPDFYSFRCSKLDEIVKIGWFDTHCKCGAEIIGVPKKE